VMDVSSEPLDLAALHPGKQPYIPRVWEAEWRFGQQNSLLPLAESRTAISQLSIAWPTRYRPTDWAVLAADKRWMRLFVYDLLSHVSV
jgi:hypothetical protein